MTPEQLKAFRRLEAAGDPQSDSNQKLREAAQILANYITSIVPRGAKDAHAGNYVVTEQDGAMVLKRSLPVGDSGIINSQSPLHSIYRFAEDLTAELMEEFESRADTLHRIERGEIGPDQFGDWESGIGITLMMHDYRINTREVAARLDITVAEVNRLIEVVQDKRAERQPLHLPYTTRYNARYHGEGHVTEHAASRRPRRRPLPDD